MDVTRATQNGNNMELEYGIVVSERSLILTSLGPIVRHCRTGLAPPLLERKGFEWHIRQRLVVGMVRW
jgi:hypothetical protein